MNTDFMLHYTHNSLEWELKLISMDVEATAPSICLPWEEFSHHFSCHFQVTNTLKIEYVEAQEKDHTDLHVSSTK